MVELTGSWLDLCLLLHNIDDISETEFLDALSNMELSSAFKSGIRKAFRGNTGDLLSSLFSAPPTQEDPVVLLAPVNIRGKKHFAWMIGHIPSSLVDLRKRFTEAREYVRVDPLLINHADPPFVLFVEPVAVSRVQMIASGDSELSADDFAIFRAGRTTDDEEDVDQQLLLDLNIIRQNLQEAYKTGRSVFGDSFRDVESCLREDVDLLGMIHGEAHNRGHFAGPWPFTRNKSSLMHEAVEEFRACLCAIQWGEHLGLTSVQKDALAVSIFLTRFLHYGLRAYKREIKTRQSIREISVGLMFFETLRHDGVIRDGSGSVLSLNIGALRPSLKAMLTRLHGEEKKVRLLGSEALRGVFRSLYHLAYPSGKLSFVANRIYERR